MATTSNVRVGAISARRGNHQERMMVRLLTIVALLFATPAPAAEMAVINLSCDGTMEIAGTTETQEPVKKFGLIVNLAAHTVSGFSVVARITSVDDATVEFNGAAENPLGASSVLGNIDRVTGKTWAWTIGTAKDGKIVTSRAFDLVCKVTGRLF
jgi:hypothetical protein